MKLQKNNNLFPLKMDANDQSHLLKAMPINQYNYKLMDAI